MDGLRTETLNSDMLLLLPLRDSANSIVYENSNVEARLEFLLKSSSL